MEERGIKVAPGRFVARCVSNWVEMKKRDAARPEMFYRSKVLEATRSEIGHLLNLSSNMRYRCNANSLKGFASCISIAL